MTDERPERASSEREPWIPFFATCAAGTEVALKDELRELRMHRVRADRGGVRFEGSMEEAFRACLWSRIAIRILMPIARFPAADGEALYEGARAIEWERWISPSHTLAVSAVSKKSALTHTSFVALRTKDAIVDRLREREGARPDVHRDDPDVSVFVHLANDEAAVHLDLAGESLHRRGYRTVAGEAPLKETLAAAMLRICGWDRVRPLVDPCCGSGTIPIEADLWARDVAPQLGRDRFGFERWASHDESLRAIAPRLRDEARAKEHDGPPIAGSDVDARVIITAETNARRAGSRVRFRRAPLRDLQATEPPAHIIANLPYGHRIEVGDVYRDLAEALPRLRGSTLSLLLQEPPPAGLLPRPAASHELWNGRIPCRLVTYRL